MSKAILLHRIGHQISGDMPTAPRYHIVDDLAPTRPTGDRERFGIRYVSYEPRCVVLVLPLALPASCDRDKLVLDMQGKSISASDDPADGVRLRSDPLVIVDDVQAADVQGQKGSYQWSMSLGLGPSPVNYLAAILPGDRIMCWMVTSADKARSIVDRIKRLDPVNLWADGLRFSGIVEGVDRDRSTTPSGVNTVHTQVTALGFSQLGSSIFYDPFLAEATPLMGTWLARIGGAVSDLLGSPLPNGGDGLDINRLMPFFVNLLLGEGVASRLTNPSGEPELRIGTGLGRGTGEAPYALVEPGQLGLLLGKRNPARSTVLSYADVLELVVGVQRFTSTSGQTGTADAPWALFTPDGIVPVAAPEDFPDVASRKDTGPSRRLLGSFLPSIPSFANRPIWAILSQYLNPAVNEMFTTMRSNEAGQVVPTLVVRQLPLSSEGVADRMQSEHGLCLTPFLEVPRWVGHPCIVRRDRLGRSNALRFNFVHVYGQSLDSQAASRYTAQIVRSPPARNDLDIQRSGLRPFTATVACSVKDSATGEGAKKWIAISSDWLMDQHLTLSGTVSLELVPGPIALGDNFEYDGVVAQIEGLQHSFRVVAAGRTSAGTTLNLTHGVRSDSDPAYAQPAEGEGDLHLFAATGAADQRTYDGSASSSTDRAAVRYANSGAPAQPPGGFTADPSGELDVLLRSQR